MELVRRGELSLMTIDQLHRRILDDLLERFGIAGLSEAETDHMNRIWHRLDPWPDARRGLERLREQFIVAPLSNGNLSLLTSMPTCAGTASCPPSWLATTSLIERHT